jgi:hypothetical protein
VRALKLGRDGERCVGQFLERLREGGAQVFHDVPGDRFNLDHVIISPHGIYAVETKTLSKPWPKAKILVDGDAIQVAGKKPDRDPVVQVTAAARWLEVMLAESTGKRFAVRGVVVYPGWFVEQRSDFGSVWVMEPKMLPGLLNGSRRVLHRRTWRWLRFICRGMCGVKRRRRRRSPKSHWPAVSDLLLSVRINNSL